MEQWCLSVWLTTDCSCHEEEIEMSTRYELPMMTYEQWLEKLSDGGKWPVKSTPAIAESYRLYVARFKADNVDAKTGQ